MTSVVRRFFAALVYFTRIPSPVPLETDANSGASSFAPIIGYVVAAFSGVIVWLAALVLPDTLVVALAMASAVWITGAMHEDGWADYCDGFGGGWSREQVMQIMRDSRTGVYAVVGLLCLLSVKFLALLELYVLWGSGAPVFVLILFSAHALSRFVAVSFMFSQDYAVSEQPSRAKSMSQRMSATELALAAVAGLLPMAGLVLLEAPMIALVLIPVLLVRIYFARQFMARLGGYTGDCLGAVQQVTETVFYLAVLVVLTHL